MSEFADGPTDELLVSAFESAMDGMAVLDDDGLYVYVNQAHCDLYGYDDPDDLLGSTWRMLYDDEQVRRFETSILPEVDATGQWRGRAEGRKRDGTTFRQEVSLSRTAVGGLVCVVRDVSEHAAQRRALERQETILKSIRDPVYTLDPDGVITWVNGSAVDEFDGGYTRSDLIGAHVSKLLSQTDIERCLDVIERLLDPDGPDSERLEIAIETAYGDEIPCELNMTLLPFDDGEFQGTVGVVRDLRDRKRREQQLSVLNRVLRHNLRNRMTVLLGNLDAVAEHVGPAGLEALEVVEATAADVLELSETASRIETVIERDEDRRSTANVVEVVRRSAADFRESHPEATISVDAPDSLTAIASDRLRAAVDSVIENAIEHAETEPEVAIDVNPPGPATDFVSITVQDNGPGIPDSEIEILDREREGPLSHGSGLGLWFVHWYVDSVGGDLEFEEAPDGGTVVRLLLRPP